MDSWCRYLVICLVVGLPHSASTAQTVNTLNKTDTAISSPYQQCPTWFYWNETALRCECGHEDYTVTCIQAKNHTWLNWLYCMTYDDATDSTVVAVCPFGDLRANHSHPMILPQNRSELNEARSVWKSSTRGTALLQVQAWPWIISSFL